MEIYSDGILNLKKIQKIEKNYINIFSEKLKNNLVKIILRYLDIKEICEFSKRVYLFIIISLIMKIL